jgi:transglutaminase-like putative cysteine protease
MPPLLLVLGVWRLYLEGYRKRLPNRWLVTALGVLGAAAVLAGAVGPADPDAVLALLVLLAGVKLLETRTARDRVTGVLVGYFVVLANFLYRDTPAMAAYMGAVVLLLTSTLIDTADDRGSRPLRLNLLLAAKMLAQAVPLAVALFLLFPRIAVPLWGAPRDSGAGQTGLSDTMAPGSISRLSLSQDLAFRASFGGSRGPQPLYWRGPVFEATDGATWSVDRSRNESLPPSGALAGGIEQTITLEPGSGRWLLGLDTPVTSPRQAELTETLSLRALRPVVERLRYGLVSLPPPRPGVLADGLRARDLQLPVRVSPRVRALAEGFLGGARTDAEVVDRALQHIRRGLFSYTLEPPLATADPVDQFLFETRRGFCEHYAGAFTLLMRLAAIPSRVVTGYLGGEWNPVGRYWIVRQADAHAWSEVWLEGRGWVRVDPTAWVAPERVERRIAPGAVGAGGFLPLGVGRFGLWLRLAWDSVDNGWNQWVLGYGAERQLALLTRVGFEDVTWEWLTIALAAVFGILVALTALQVGRGHSVRPDPVLALYRRYCLKLARRSLPRLPSEGPRAYCQRVCRIRPDLAVQVQTITEDYEALRYAPPPLEPATGRETLRALRAAVRRFRP